MVLHNRYFDNFGIIRSSPYPWFSLNAFNLSESILINYTFTLIHLCKSNIIINVSLILYFIKNGQMKKKPRVNPAGVMVAT